MSKFKKILYTGICIIIITISIVRIGELFFSVYLGLGYNYAIWCGKEEKEYIKSHSNINSDFSIAVANINWNINEEKSAVIRGYPTIFAKVIDTDSSLTMYIRENNNPSEVFIKCSLPYIIGFVVAMLVFRKKLLPAFNDDE